MTEREVEAVDKWWIADNRMVLMVVEEPVAKVVKRKKEVKRVKTVKRRRKNEKEYTQSLKRRDVYLCHFVTYLLRIRKMMELCCLVLLGKQRSWEWIILEHLHLPLRPVNKTWIY